MNTDKIEALLLEALDYHMGVVPESLIREALSLLPVSVIVKRDGDRRVFTDPGSGMPWLVVLVQPGHRYGSMDQATGARWLVNTTGKPMIEFWDRRYPHDAEHKAQFVTRYYLSTFMNHAGALMLDTGSKDWRLSERSVEALQKALK